MTPIYEFDCKTHGRFESLRPMSSIPALCPVCDGISEKVMSCPAPARIIEHRRLQYGSGSPGRIIPGKETGGLDLFIPSGGALEKEEVDYVVCAAIEKEKARVKSTKGHSRSANQEAISQLSNLAYQTKPGQRIKVLNEAIAESGLGNKIKVA